MLWSFFIIFVAIKSVQQIITKNKKDYETDKELGAHRHPYIGIHHGFMRCKYIHSMFYGSLSDFYSESWNNQTSADVVIKGNNVTLTALENEYTKHVTVTDIYTITDKEMTLKSDWTVYVNGAAVIHEAYDNERYVRITNDYEQDIIGTWEGKVTSQDDEHSDGELHRWEYKANGTYVYYNKSGDQWVNSNDALAEYFGTALPTPPPSK